MLKLFLFLFIAICSITIRAQGVVGLQVSGPTTNPNIFTDPLDAGTIDTALWSNYLTGPDGAFITVAETTSLNITTDGSTFTGTTRKGLITTVNRNMTGLRWSIHRTANTGGNYFEFIGATSGSTEIYILFNAASANIEAYGPGPTFLGNCTVDDWWSIRHNSGTDHLIFETSPDGSTWTQCTGGDVAAGAFDETTVKYSMFLQGLAGYNSIRTLSWNTASVQ